MICSSPPATPSGKTKLSRRLTPPHNNMGEGAATAALWLGGEGAEAEELDPKNWTAD